MTWLLAFLLSILNPPTSREVSSFRLTAPDYLSTETARENLVAARAAGAVYRVPPQVLLAVGWHESRYMAGLITAEPGNRVSCGVMTPVPKRRCALTELTLIGGYDEGAKHLRVWMDLCHDGARCAILAYAGGFGLVRACSRGPWMVGERDVCQVADQVLERARWIKRVLKEK